MKGQQLIPHLFRNEFGKIVSVLCKTFSIEQIELAEDIVSETFLSALETWPFKGLPENPQAWLYTVAKNKTRNHLLRNHILHEKVAPELKTSAAIGFEIDWSENNMT